MQPFQKILGQALASTSFHPKVFGNRSNFLGLALVVFVYGRLGSSPVSESAPHPPHSTLTLCASPYGCYAPGLGKGWRSTEGCGAATQQVLLSAVLDVHDEHHKSAENWWRHHQEESIPHDRLTNADRGDPCKPAAQFW